MERFTDSRGRILDIEMKTWDGGGYSPPFEMDFFNCGSLGYSEEFDCYYVADVTALLDAADAWRRGRYNEWDSRCDDEPTQEEIDSRTLVYTLYQGAYYWLDLNYNGEDAFALWRGFFDADGEKDRRTEEVVCNAKFADLGVVADDLAYFWDAIDKHIEEEIGFCPDYEVG